MIDTSTEQGTLDWHRARLKHFCGSLIWNLMTTGRKKDEIFGETAKSYIKSVMFERLLDDDMIADDEMFTQYLEETNVTTRAMRIGSEREADAVNVFNEITEERFKIVEVSSCKHDTIPYYAASPDRLLVDKETNDLVVLEVKCPSGNAFVTYLTEVNDGPSLQSVKKEYYWQMQAEMDCTGAKYGIFCVYNPHSKKPIKLVKIERNDEDIELLHERIILANQIIEEKLNAI